MPIFFEKNQRFSLNNITIYYIAFYFKIIAFFIIALFIFIFFFYAKSHEFSEKNLVEDDCLLIKKNSCFNKINTNINKNEINNIINENFFVIDSNNLSNIKPHLYGFIVSKNGILTDNYFKKLGEYKEPEPQGVYIMIRKIGKEIIINQDFYGSFGIYIYENKNENYLALSNSFFLLQEYLVKKKKLSLNKDYANNLIVTKMCSFSLDETLINEIKIIPSNSFIVINIEENSLRINYINYQENSILLESKEGLEIIDNWFDKWVYIFRSLKKKTNNVSADLSGGFDSRTMITILLNSGFKMDELNIKSIVDNKHEHDVDFKIAKNISIKYGFKLNNFNFDNDITNWSMKESLFNTIYSKLGFHKELYLLNYFYNKPIFSFSGSGGEFLRGFPNMPIQEFLNINSLSNINNRKKEFYFSSKKIFNRSINLLKKEKEFNNDFEISSDLYSKSVGKNHFGRNALVKFLANMYVLQPLMDPEIKKIKFNINNITCHDLIAYIYIRFAHDLIDFPFQGERILNLESIKKAEKLNHNYKPHKNKLDYNKNFYIDKERISPVNSTKAKEYSYDYLEELFKTRKYIKIINKLYDKNIYDWAKKYSYTTNYYPLAEHYALLSIAVIFNSLKLNARYLKNF